MKKWISRILLVLVGLVVGLVIGAGVVVYYSTISFNASTEMLAMNYAAWEGQEAYYHYKNKNYDSAEQAFSHILKVYEGFEKFNEKTNRNIVQAEADIAVTYVRLGNIAESKGMQRKAEEYFKKAVVYYQKHCRENGIEKEYTSEKLRELVERIDSKQTSVELRPFSSVLYVSEE